VSAQPPNLWGDPPPKDARELLGRLWQIGREEAAKRQQVVQAVREAGHGKTRDELRSLYEVELDRHGVPRNPIWVERQLDEAEWSPLERARQTARGLLMASGALGRMARSHGIPEAPRWMQPPDHATHHAWAPQLEKTPVDIDPDACARLDQTLTSAPGRVGELIALVDVWFDWDVDRSADAPVTVNLGDQRVGVLDATATNRFAPVMRAAAERGAKPRASASLAKAEHLQPPYLLVVEVPVPDPAA
jgi:hypothetical protein